MMKCGVVHYIFLVVSFGFLFLFSKSADVISMHNNSTYISSAINSSTKHYQKNEFHAPVCESPWNNDNVEAVISSWNFNEAEQAKLSELQIRLSDIDHWKNDPAEVARFIKEHNFNVDKAEQMFRGMIDWRKNNQIDSFMERYGEPPEIFHYAPIFLLKGFDKNNDPILVLRIGKLDALGLYKRMGEKSMIQAYQFLSELHTSRDFGLDNGWNWQREYYEPLAGRRVTQFTILVDLEGLNSRLLRPALFKVLKKTSRIAQDHYPGLAKRMFVIRAPKLFEIAWKAAKHFFDPRVHHKFIFTRRDDYLDVLSEYIDLDVLPPVLYENGKGKPMPGWFEENIHMEGGLIPRDSKLSTSAEDEDKVLAADDATSESSTES